MSGRPIVARVAQLVALLGLLHADLCTRSDDWRLTTSSGRDWVKNGDARLVTRLTAGMPPPQPATRYCASSLLLPVEVGQQVERALEQFRRDKAGGQALFDLQADQHRLPDGPGLDGRDPSGELIAVGTVGVG